MRQRSKCALSVLLCAAAALSLAGCGVSGSIYSNYREMSQLRPVRTLGCDWGPEGVTLSASTGDLGEIADEPLTLCCSAGSVAEAMASLQDRATHGQLFFSHIEYVLLGREAAEQGLWEVLDYLERDPGMRLDTELFVLAEGRADALVQGAGDGATDITELLRAIREDVERSTAGHVCTVRETAVALSEYGAALACLLRAEADEENETKTETLLPLGYAILRDGALAGTVEGKPAETLSLLLRYPGTARRELSGAVLDYDGAGVELRPAWDAGGSPAPMEVRLSVRASLAELRNTGAPAVEDEAGLQSLEDALAGALETELRELLEQSRQLDADFLGLGGILRRSDAAAWEALPPDWLRDMRFDVHAEAVIDRSYDLGERVGTAGEKEAA